MASVLPRKKCPYSELFWAVFSCIRTKYGVSLRIPSECGKMRPRITPNTDTFHVVYGPQIWSIKKLWQDSKYASVLHCFNNVKPNIRQLKIKYSTYGLKILATRSFSSLALFCEYNDSPLIENESIPSEWFLHSCSWVCNPFLG